MRIVQTFWSAEGDLSRNAYGWFEPQYHLMSWALSCLSLRENYDEVVLYTDSLGYQVLVEQLKLPYTDVIVQYDNLLCPKPHWAYPKVLTYSLQKEPFVHVDGDVYLPGRLSRNVEMGGLIAQNLETGSSYYKNMMNNILQRELSLPDFLKEELEKDSIGAYNAGVLGGNDLEFIKEYCQTAFHIIENNHLNDMSSQKIDIGNNILFEQILFYALSKVYDKSVSTPLDHSVRDNGYTYQEFCDFYLYDNTKLMHIIGGHKRNQRVCELLGKTLLNKYPDYHKRIVELFPYNHKRLQGENKYTITSDLTSQMCVATYQDHLSGLSTKWEKISNEDLYDQEKRSSAYIDFLNVKREIQDSCILSKNPYLSVFEIPKHWSLEVKHLLKDRVNKGMQFGDFDIVCIPCILGKGYREIIIKDICYNILALLEEGKTFECLLKELLPCLSAEIKKDEEQAYRLVMSELEYLFYNGLIYTQSF